MYEKSVWRLKKIIDKFGILDCFIYISTYSHYTDVNLQFMLQVEIAWDKWSPPFFNYELWIKKRQFDEVNYELKGMRFLTWCANSQPLRGDNFQAGCKPLCEMVRVYGNPERVTHDNYETLIRRGQLCGTPFLFWNIHGFLKEEFGMECLFILSLQLTPWLRER